VYSQPTFKCKEILPLKPDTLWKIESGVVRSLTWDEEGRTTTLGFWGEGDVVGQPLSRMKPYQVECLTTVQVSELLPGSSYLQQALLVHAWKSGELLSVIHQPSVANRLLLLLEWLSHQFGKPVAQGTRLDLRLTHQVLADTIGSTRVSVTRLLGELEQDRKIQRSQRTLILCR
jgi:CRP-like cAMP-binding protein